MSKKIILYGNADCPDCVEAKERLDREGIRYGYVDVLAGLGHLKKFLYVRDTHPDVFRDVLTHSIGIPCAVIDDKEVYVVGTEAFEQALFGR